LGSWYYYGRQLVFRDCDVCLEMVMIPAGGFTMGSPASVPGRESDEGPQHAVTISRQFAAGQYEVTFDEWDACVREGGCGHNPDDGGRGRRPVINVTWDDTGWVSKKTGKNYRLLTEAEWEYAARAGTTSRYYWGDSDTDICRYASVNKGGKGCGTDRTSPVGSRQPNAFGLHDMSGNVWEWAEDCGKLNCVMRGGSWDGGPQGAGSAVRFELMGANRNSFIGFRVARTN